MSISDDLKAYKKEVAQTNQENLTNKTFPPPLTISLN